MILMMTGSGFATRIVPMAAPPMMISSTRLHQNHQLSFFHQETTDDGMPNTNKIPMIENMGLTF